MFTAWSCACNASPISRAGEAGVVLGDDNLRSAGGHEVGAEAVAVLVKRNAIECGNPLDSSDNATPQMQTSATVQSFRCAEVCRTPAGEFLPECANGCCERECTEQVSQLFFDGSVEACQGHCFSGNPPVPVAEDKCVIKVSTLKRALPFTINDDYRMSRANETCDDLPFNSEALVEGWCSSFLLSEGEVKTSISPNVNANIGHRSVMVSNEHCVPDLRTCEDSAVIFDFTMDALKASNPWAFDGDNLKEHVHYLTIARDQVFTCDDLLVAKSDRFYERDDRGNVICGKETYSYDHAVFVLDRLAKRQGVALSDHPLPIGKPVSVLGHPTSLTMKIDDTGHILTNEGRTFTASLDTWRGHSGSLVVASNEKEPTAIGITFAYRMKPEANRWVDYCLKLSGPSPTTNPRTLSCGENCECVAPPVPLYSNLCKAPYTEEEIAAREEERDLWRNVQGCWAHARYNADQAANLFNWAWDIKRTLGELQNRPPLPTAERAPAIAPPDLPPITFPDSPGFEDGEGREDIEPPPRSP